MTLRHLLRLASATALLLTAGMAGSVGRHRPPAVLAASAPHIACCGAITPEGYKLAALIDSMHVEDLWAAHRHVNWETGEPDRPEDYTGAGKSTHCSAFAAALGERLNVYMLRPPDHSQILLASAQVEWFHSGDGVKNGWRPLESEQRAHDAQMLANKGDLVTIAFESPDPHKPGHIVIVRPSEKSAEDLAMEGPQVAQAGTLNHSSSIAATSFRSHPGAWPNGVKYYAHPVDWSKVETKP